MPVSDIPAGATPISQSDLTPAELAELGHGLPSGATPIDPVAELSAPELAELQVGKLFDPIAWADSNQHKAFEPATLQKLSEAHDIVTSRGLGGFVVGDIGAVQSAKEGKPIEAIGKVVEPVAKTAWNMAKWFGNALVTDPALMAAGKANELFGGNPDLTNEYYKQAAKNSAEITAATESGLFGLATAGAHPMKAATKQAIVNAMLGSKPAEIPGQTDEVKKQQFLSDLSLFQQKQKIGSGQGEFAKTEGTSAEDMAKIGVKLDPNTIGELASGEPFSFYAFGKAFQAITPSGKVLATIPGVAQLPSATKALTSKGLTWAAQTGVNLAGKTITGVGKVVGLAEKAAPLAGAVSGAVKAGPWGILPGIAGGEVAGRTLGAVASGLKTSGTAISEFSKKLATEAGPVGSYTQLARDIIGAAPGALAETAKGAGLDLGFAAAVSETPQDTEGMATFGTTFGALHGLAGAGRQVIQGQALAPRPWGTTEKTKPYGNFANLDAAHAAAEQSRAPDEVQRADAIRAFAANLPGGAEAYLMPDKAAFESALVDDYTKKNGVAPTGDALAKIKSNSQANGMFSADLLDDSGQQRKVILLNQVDAAPHEAAHAIQDVIGDKANQVVDALVKDTYAGTWEAQGQDYARRLAPGDARPWREVIVDRTGYTDADTFLARELAAENFDVAFKNKGGDFGRGDTLPEKLARIAARTAVFFGGDPYAGAETQGLGIQPNAGVIEAVKKQADLAQRTPPVMKVAPLVTPRAAPAVPTIAPAAPAVPTIAPAAPAVPTIAPAAPAVPTIAPAAPAVPTSSAVGVSPDAKAAQAWAAGKSDPRLVNIVNSIVANQVRSAPGEAAPVRLKYLSVAGEADSTRTPRRSEQEAAYLAEALGAMPAETRALVEKTHAHVRFEATKKGNELQSIGFSLEKLVENAQRAAKWLAGNDAARSISPYEVDSATGSFKPDAWKQLVSDIQIYTENQQAGGTGAGKPLALPANAVDLKISTPTLSAVDLVPLEQSKADFINTLMGFKLPETTRVSRAGGTPGNIVGQEISKANEQPFIQPRISEPAVQRGGGKEFAGFPGRTIKEVNPLRRQLEAAGFPVGELTEVVERVNLKHLESVTPAPEVNFRPGVTDTIRAGFLPAETEADQVEKLTQQELQGWSAGQKGGYTATAHRVGQEAPNQAFVDSLKVRADRFKKEALDGMQNDNFDAAMTSSTKAQFFREAWEAATGTGSAGERLSKVDPNYKPRFSAEAKTQFSPNAEVKDVADEYAKSAGLKPATFQMRPVNDNLAKRLADFYDEAKHSPNDPAVQKSYKALADETLAQYKAMTDAGYTIEPFEGKGEPYKNSAEMTADVQDNKHLYFLKTEGNFSGENNPLLAPSGVEVNGSELAVNDVFRAVHDFFGHAKEGLQFGPKGEFNAWRAHSEMYSPEAQGALAAETLAQNSFVNFGKHLRDKSGNIPAKGEPGYVALPDRQFAEQKNVVVPAGLIAEAKSQFSPKGEEDPYAKYNVDYLKAVAKRKAGGKSGLTGWILPNNKFTPLESNYHEQYLAENSESLNKKFGTKFSEKENVEERQQALDKGFVRLRMQGGTLHVESGQAGWTKAARDKVFETVADNLDNIDQIQISLLDKNGIVKRQGHERLMDYETDAEKLDHIPLISDAK